MSDQKSAPTIVALPAASVNARSLPTTYSNYFRANGSAEELILDFGLDPQRHKQMATP